MEHPSLERQNAFTGFHEQEELQKRFQSNRMEDPKNFYNLLLSQIFQLMLKFDTRICCNKVLDAVDRYRRHQTWLFWKDFQMIWKWFYLHCFHEIWTICQTLLQEKQKSFCHLKITWICLKNFTTFAVVVNGIILIFVAVVIVIMM